MTKARLAIVWAGVGLAAACAGALRGGGGVAPEERLARGLSALDHADYGAAFDDLAWVYRHCAEEDVGTRALLALTALELDPRNAQRRPAVAAELAAIRLAPEARWGWSASMARILYAVALDLGATAPSGTLRGLPTRPPVAATAAPRSENFQPCEPESAAGPVRVDTAALPRLPGPGLADRLQRLEARAVREDSLLAALESARASLAERELRITELQTELERIRRTLRP